MANRVFIIPRRNDLVGVGIHLNDLHPNAGQKNGVYDGTHQNVYLAEMIGVPGATVVNGLAYVSGSKETTLAAAHNFIDDRTSVAAGGNNVQATQQTAFGLAAYIMDRIDPGGAGGAGTNPIAFANANALAIDIMQAAAAGNALTLAAINVILSAVVANTDLDGAAATSVSFGSVEDILRILAGEIYRVPLLTIVGDDTGGTSDFLGLVARQAIVAAQLVTDVTTYGQFYASGDFLAADDAGYQARPTLVRTGAFNLSVASGVISGLAAAPGITLLNTNNHAYAAADVLAWRPRATYLDQTVVPATGIAPAIAAYDHLGNNLA